MRALELTTPIGRNPRTTLPVRMIELAERFDDRPALIGEDEVLTYRGLAERSNRYTRWALEQGLQHGDVVCLVMHNRPDYLAAWLGLSRAGVVVSLINTNLIGDSLAHAIGTASPKLAIVGPEVAKTIAGILPHLATELPCWVRGADVPNMARMDDSLEGQSAAPVSEQECAAPSIRDAALYIYTSGTTGLPKAARVSHRRVMQWSYWFAGLIDTTEHDRMYNCLPMYHAVGGVVALGSVLVHGGSVVLRRKFSVRGFWRDVVRTESTLFQYIGELCRFLLNAPSDPEEREHRIRLACGNGMRPDVWEPFQTRFAIPRVLEFYAATEANFSLYNCDGKPGAIGRIPPFLRHRFPVVLIAVDPETNEPVRDEHGRCRQCAVGDVGEAVARIVTDGSSPEGQFDGYTDRVASERKVLRNAFEEGDAWFRSGDLMRQDPSGFFYFVDRLGDTYRWKGENVSTTEVAEAVSAWPEVAEALVYGVEVPGNEGRAGMVAIVPKRAEAGLDLAGLRDHLRTRLPDYAQPVFVRVVTEIESTGTFKPKKQDLARAGYDPSVGGDPLFVSDRAADAFVPLDHRTLESIRSGQLRL